MIGLAKALAVELAPDVRVNVINPGPANTPMLTGFGFDADVAAGAAAEAADRARGHRRRRRLPGLRRRASDHRRRLQHRRGAGPVTSFMAVDPSTGHEFAQLPETTPGAGRRAGRGRPPRARGGDELAHADRARAGRCSSSRGRSRRRPKNLADFETRDTGKPLSQAKADVAGDDPLPRVLRGLDRAHRGPRRSRSARTRSTTRVREPWGVCGQIIPWNYPLQVAARCAAPALAAGNAVILKPSELASITPLRLADLAERAGVPRGMFQIATGDGEVGAALVEHGRPRHVRRLARTTGAKVAEACAQAADPDRARARRQVAERRLRRRRPRQGRVPAIVQVAAAERGPELLGGLAAAGRAARSTTRSSQRSQRRSTRSRSAPGIEDPDLGPLISERQLRARARRCSQTAARGGRARSRGGDTPRGPVPEARAGHRRHAGHGDLPGGGLRPGARRGAVRRTSARRSSSPTRPPTGSSPASGRRTSRGRTASPRASERARCSSTATASAAGSSCRSAAWAAAATGAARASRRCSPIRRLKNVWVALDG